MRLVCISDTHTRHFDHVMPAIPDGDVLIHAGDISMNGDLDDIVSFNEWLGTLPHKHKIIICGNHDFCFEKFPNESRDAISNAIYLQDSSIEINGITFYGSPWQPWYLDFAFNLQRGEELRKKWAEIPESTNVLVTHGPPIGILDRIFTGEEVGCEELLKRLDSLSKLKLHVFGHIHECYGMCDYKGIKMVNASICSVDYRPVNSPIVVDI